MTLPLRNSSSETAPNGYRPCLIIPCYNHGSALLQLHSQIELLQLPIFVVDDGSSPEQAQYLREFISLSQDRTLLTHKSNSGKGVAARTGMAYALEQGMTHGIQIDADGQHDLKDIAAFISESARHPDDLILGAPIFGADAPRARVWGRKVANFMVILETRSFSAIDVLCGFRVYPLKQTVAILEKGLLNERMGFDSEILVRLRWANTEVRNIPTKVNYPEGGLSNYRYFTDNIQMIASHTVLFLRSLIYR